MTTSFVLFATSLGDCAVVWTERGIASIYLPEATRERTIARIESRFPGATEDAPPPAIKRAVAHIAEHLEGTRKDLTHIPLDLTGVPPFHERVLAVARTIPFGETLTYGAIAERLGSPGSARAVGQAMGKNPFPIVVPCHRVLGAGGRTGGFSAYGGVTTKAAMLAREGVSIAPAPLFATQTPLPYDADLATRHLEAKDRRLAALMQKVGPYRLALDDAEGTFAALAQSIVYQQLTGKAAATIFGRVKMLFPKKRLSPEALLRVPDAKLREAGLSNAKTLALKDLAAKCVDGTVPPLAALEKLDDDAIVERLTQVRGIGRWTVEMLLIFRLGRPDVLPVDDYGVRKGFARTFKKKELPTPKELRAYGEKWRPYRSVASWYLWRALDSE